EVENAVDEKDLQLALQRMPELAGLARGIRDVDREVPERTRLVLPRAVRRTLLAREREDVGRPVLLPEVPVQRPHPGVAAEEDRERGAAPSGAVTNRACPLRDAPGGRSAGTSYGDGDVDGGRPRWRGL